MEKLKLDEMNPAKAKYTRRYSSDSALDAIQEIMVEMLAD